MTALSKERSTQQVGANADPEVISMPMSANKIWQGAIVCDNGSGYAIEGSTSTSLIAVGRAEETVDNSAGSNGDLNIQVRRGVFNYGNSAGGDEITIADRFSECYIVDDQTVAKTDGSSTRSRAGLVWDVRANGTVDVLIGAATQASISAAEGDIQDIETHLLSAQVRLGVPLATLRETTNFDAGNIAANGGLLASDTTPILSAINDATDGCQRVTWAASNSDQVMFQMTLPADLDDTADLKLYTRTASGGTTDAVGFTVDSFFNEGDTKVTDTSATNQTTTYANALTTIAAADVPAGATTLTVGLTPVAHTTDTLNLTAVWIEYKRKLLTS